MAAEEARIVAEEKATRQKREAQAAAAKAKLEQEEALRLAAKNNRRQSVSPVRPPHIKDSVLNLSNLRK